MPLQALQVLERKIGRPIRLFGMRPDELDKKIEKQLAIHKKKIEQTLESRKQQFETHRKRLGRKIERTLETRKAQFKRQKKRIGSKIEQTLETRKQQFETHRKRIGSKIEQTLETRKQQFETHKRRIGTKIEVQIRRFEQKKGIRIDDEVRFFRNWIEKPLSMGAVTPSGRALARTMAAYVDPTVPGPIIELGPGTGPVTEALVAQGIDPARLVLVEFDPAFCRLLQERYPTATVVQGDAYSLGRLLTQFIREPAAAVVSGLPLFTKPLTTRLRLLFEAFSLMMPGAPFVQFTYAAYSPIPKALDRVYAEASERIWTNIPPARVWVYRKH
jgi:phosphatidylethanolamine/phosphatidyl-N-methylethanolamine N-methyltransferase